MESDFNSEKVDDPLIDHETPNGPPPSAVDFHGAPPTISTKAPGNARPITVAKTSLDLSSLLTGNPDTLKPVVKQETSTATNKTKAKVTADDISKAWQSFADSKKNQAAEYQLLNRPIEISGKIIKVILNNSVEEPLLNNMKSELLETLRQQLSNSEINIEYEIKLPIAGKVAYTNKEKLQKMSEKYPAVLELQTRLGLDTDF